MNGQTIGQKLVQTYLDYLIGGPNGSVDEDLSPYLNLPKVMVLNFVNENFGDTNEDENWEMFHELESEVFNLVVSRVTEILS